MHFELKMTMLAILITLAHILLASHSAARLRSYDWAASARDEPMPSLTGKAGRLDRAFRNFLETFGVFLAAILIVEISDTRSLWSQWGALLYCAARILYIPLYAYGVKYWRSLVWNAALLGILLILWRPFLALM